MFRNTVYYSEGRAFLKGLCCAVQDTKLRGGRTCGRSTARTQADSHDITLVYNIKALYIYELPPELEKLLQGANKWPPRSGRGGNLISGA